MRRLTFTSLACLLLACSSSDASSTDAATQGQTSGEANGAGAGSSADGSSGADGSQGAAGSASGDASSSLEAGVDGKDAAPANDAGAKLTCDPRKISCKAAETPCPEGEVHQVIDNCYGPCVPITDCPCEGPEACPHSEEFTCWNNTGHCNYYGP